MEFIGKVTFFFLLSSEVQSTVFFLITSKYCGANEFCRLYIKPSVHNKVAHVQNQKSM